MEDLGRAPDSFQVECVFNGPTWFVNLNTFREAVRDAITSATINIFVHPYWGSFEGIIRDLRVEHEDKKEDFARVNFTFVEATMAPMVFLASSSLASATAAASNAATSATSAVAALSE